MMNRGIHALSSMGTWLCTLVCSQLMLCGLGAILNVAALSIGELHTLNPVIQKMRSNVQF